MQQLGVRHQHVPHQQQLQGTHPEDHRVGGVLYWVSDIHSLNPGFTDKSFVQLLCRVYRRCVSVPVEVSAPRPDVDAHRTATVHLHGVATLPDSYEHYHRNVLLLHRRPTRVPTALFAGKQPARSSRGERGRGGDGAPGWGRGQYYRHRESGFPLRSLVFVVCVGVGVVCWVSWVLQNVCHVTFAQACLRFYRPCVLAPLLVTTT